MSNFEDFTDAQLIALTDEQIQHYRKLVAAEAGIVIPGPEPAPFDEQKPPQDCVLYVIGGVKFLDRSVAEELQAWLMARQEDLRETAYDYRVSYSTHYVKGFESELAIHEEVVYSAEEFDRLREQINGYKDRKKAADEARGTWEKETKEFDRCSEFILSRISDARERVWRQEENQRRFDEYLELASGDSAKAWAFFTKAGLDLADFRPTGAPEKEVTF